MHVLVPTVEAGCMLCFQWMVTSIETGNGGSAKAGTIRVTPEDRTREIFRDLNS